MNVFSNFTYRSSERQATFSESFNVAYQRKLLPSQMYRERERDGGVMNRWKFKEFSAVSMYLVVGSSWSPCFRSAKWRGP